MRTILFAIALACLTLGSIDARAQDSAGEEDTAIGLQLGVRGMGEVLQEPAIVELYRSSRFTGTGVLSYRVWRFLGVDLEAGYMRDLGNSCDKPSCTDMHADASALELIPVSAMASAVRSIKRAQLFASIGPAITTFSERAEDGTVSGTKWGLAVQLGARIDTGLVRPTMRPGNSVRIQGVDFEIVLGRRQHQLFGVGDGWNLSAWRVGAGLMARF